MMKHCLYFIIFLAVVYSGCSSEKNEQQSEVSNLKVEYIEEVMLSSLIEGEISYLPISSAQPIGNIGKLIVMDDTYFILDFISRNVVRVNAQGDLSVTYGGQGKGVGEYIFPNDVAIGEYVLISDGSSRRMMRYDLSGQFIDQETVPFIGDEIIMDGDELIVHSAYDAAFNKLPEGTGTIFSYNRETGDINWSFLPYLNNIDDGGTASTIWKYGDNISYIQTIVGDIHTVTNEELKTVTLDLGSYAIPIDREEMVAMDSESDYEKFQQMLSEAEFVTNFSYLIENDQYIMFQAVRGNFEEVSDGAYNQWFIWKKESNIIYAIQNVINDVDGGAFSAPLTWYDGKYYSFIDYTDVVGLNTDQLTDKVRPYYGLTEDSNPVIIQYALKRDITF